MVYNKMAKNRFKSIKFPTNITSTKKMLTGQPCTLDASIIYADQVPVMAMKTVVVAVVKSSNEERESWSEEVRMGPGNICFAIKPLIAMNRKIRMPRLAASTHACRIWCTRVCNYGAILITMNTRRQRKDRSIETTG